MTDETSTTTPPAPTPPPASEPAAPAADAAPSLAPAPAWLVWLALVAFAFVGLRTVSNTDYWTHLAWGKVQASAGITAPDVLSHASEDATFANPSWLYDKLLAIVHGMGGAGLATLLHVAAVVGAFLLLLPMTRKWAGNASIALALLLCAWILAPRFEPRPGLIGLLLAAVLIRTLYEPGDLKKVLIILIPLQVVWANLSASWQIAPLIVGVYIITSFIGRKKDDTPPPLTIYGAALAVTLIAPILNPFGTALYSSATEGWTVNYLMITQPWVSPIFDQMATSFAVYAIKISFVVGAAGLVFMKQKLPMSLTGLAVLPVFITVNSPYFAEFLALMAFPFLALSLGAIGDFIGGQAGLNRTEVRNGLPAALSAVTLFAMVSNGYYVSTGSFSSFGLGANEDVTAAAAFDMLPDDALPEGVITLIPDGGYFALNGVPGYLDHRTQFHGRERIETLRKALLDSQDPEKWNGFAETNNAEVVVFNTTQMLAPVQMGGNRQIPRLLLRHGYRLAYFDGSTAILARPTENTRALLTNRDLQRRGLQRIEEARAEIADSTGGLFAAPVPARVIAAAQVFSLLGEFAEAEKLFLLTTAAVPGYHDAWLQLGLVQLELEKAEESVRTLESALRLNKKDLRTWLYLSRAYDLTDNASAAKMALDQARSIDAEGAAAWEEQRAKQEEESSEKPAK